MVDRSLAHATEISVGRQMRFKSKLVKTSFVRTALLCFSGRSSQVSFPNRIERWTEGGSFVRWPLLVDSTEYNIIVVCIGSSNFTRVERTKRRDAEFDTIDEKILLLLKDSTAKTHTIVTPVQGLSAPSIQIIGGLRASEPLVGAPPK